MDDSNLLLPAFCSHLAFAHCKPWLKTAEGDYSQLTLCFRDIGEGHDASPAERERSIDSFAKLPKLHTRRGRARRHYQGHVI